MWTFKTGDLIGKTHPSFQEPIQIGLVIRDTLDTFMVKWTYFDKIFFMEKEGDIFEDLNKRFLLNTVQIHRSNTAPCLVLLNSSYLHERQRRKNGCADQNDITTI